MRKLFTFFILFLWVISLRSQTVVTITCTGTAGSYKSGSVNATGTKNDGNMVTINTSTNRGWATYDLSGLSGATVSAVTANFTTYTSTSSSATNNLYGFTGDPATMDGAALYTACGSGLTFNASSWVAAGLNTKVFTAAGLTFVNTYVGGMINIGYVRGSSNTYNIYGYSGTTPPDLVITYTGGAPCTGTPDPGNTVSTANPACPGANFTLSLQNPTPGSGVAYQWQTSPDGMTPWTNAGTSLPSYTASQTTTTWYRCEVTCDANTGTSTPLEVTMNNFLNCYCPSGASSTGDEDITNVTFGSTLNNTSACASLTGTQGTATGTADLYSNFTSITPTDVIQSLTSSISVTITQCAATAYGHDVRVYLDFNQNGLLTDAGEEFIIWPYASLNTHTITADIPIPLTATIGTTLMRVVCKESSTTGPCIVGSWGETEDYLVNIIAATAPALVVSPGAINFGYAASGTSSAEMTYNLSGINLTPADGSITITPPANFEVSDKTGGPYSATPITVDYVGGTLAASPVYAVFKPTSPNTDYSGNISNAGGGAPAANVAVSGTSNLIYCSSGATSSLDEEIFSVTLNGVTNAYDCFTVAPGPGSILHQYSNFKTLGSLTTIQPGSTVSFTILEDECDGPTYYSNGCAMWIDFNQNGLFTDPGEEVYTETGTTISPRTISGSFTVPSGATFGETVMRVTVAEGFFGATLTPCLSYGYGETEDYIVTIGLPPDHDAGTVSIDNVPPFHLIGTPIVPKATVQNFGLNAEVFDVTITGTGGYTSTVSNVSLASGASTQVSFAGWDPPAGNYTVGVCTQLAGDLNPSNDCKSQTMVATNASWGSGAVYPTTTYLGTGVGYTDNSVAPPVGYLYSFGGNTASTLGTECYKYNVTTDTWTAITSLPGGRRVVASAIVGDNIYILGGSDMASVYQSTVYKYNIPGDTWTTVASLPVATGWGKAVGYGTNHIYFAGGVDGASVVLSTVYVYDIALDTWTAATSMPAGLFGGAFSRTGNTLVYVAGADLAVISNTVYVGTISGGDPTSISWITAKNPYPGTTGQPSPELVKDITAGIATYSGIINNRVSYPAGAMYRFDGAPWGTDGIIVAAGSPSAAWTPAVPNPCYVYIPSTDTWIQKPDLPVPVLGPSLGTVDLENAGVHIWKLIVASGLTTGSIATNATQILTETFGIPENLTVTGTAANTACYNASNTITVAGGATTFTVQAPNGNVTFIAGMNILFEPGTHVEDGAYMHGYISTTYCTNPTAPVVAAVAGLDEPLMKISNAWFSLYPNPTTGNFTIVQKGDKVYGTVTVEIYSISGKKALAEQMIGEKQHEFRISGIPAGLYFVKVVAEDYVETIKLVKTR